MSTLLWLPFLAISFLYTMRLHQTSGRKERTGFILLGLGAVIAVAAAAFAGPTHAVLMVVAWFALPFVLRPLAARVGDSFADTSPRPRDASADARMARLKTGEISLDEYFKDGDRASREGKERLASLARRPEIAAMLKRHHVSFRQLCVLREQLSMVPELEWKILGSPEGVEDLIELAGSGKTPRDLARIFRAKERSRPGRGDEKAHVPT